MYNFFEAALDVLCPFCQLLCLAAESQTFQSNEIKNSDFFLFAICFMSCQVTLLTDF